MQKKHIAFLTVGALLLITATAGATAYFIQKDTAPDEITAAEAKNKPITTKRIKSDNIQWDKANAAPQQQRNAPVQTASACNDGNIAGKVVGGVGGGVLGSMVGKGNGKTAMTIGGTLGGAYAGGEMIPLHNATCR